MITTRESSGGIRRGHKRRGGRIRGGSRKSRRMIRGLVGRGGRGSVQSGG
jgi:hypothetical protein